MRINQLVSLLNYECKEKISVTEVLDMRRNHQNNGPDPYQIATDQSADIENDGRDRVQTDAERLRYGMVVTADRVPERDGIRHAERISTGPPPADTFEHGKQIVAIGDYEEDEHYIDDDGYRTDDGGGKFFYALMSLICIFTEKRELVVVFHLSTLCNTYVTYFLFSKAFIKAGELFYKLYFISIIKHFRIIGRWM